MDPRTNPYAPGAGSPPPELAGRGHVIEASSIALDRMRNGLVARSVMLVGLRGVGKTVLLNRLHKEAEAKGFATVLLEAPEKRSLPALLVPAMRAALPCFICSVRDISGDHAGCSRYPGPSRRSASIPFPLPLPPDSVAG